MPRQGTRTNASCPLCFAQRVESGHQFAIWVILADSNPFPISGVITTLQPLYGFLNLLVKPRVIRITPNISVVCPRLALTRTQDTSAFYPQSTSQVIHTSPLPYQFATEIVLVYIVFKGFFSSCRASAIADIIQVGTPLQVVNAIIGLILVLVVNLWVVVGIRNKGKCYKPMYLATMSLSTVAKVNTQIALPTDTGLHTFALATLTRGCLNPSEVTNLVDTIGVNVFPNFFHFSWPKKRKGAYCRGLGQEIILSRNNSPTMGLSNVLLARPRYKEITRFHNKYTTLL